jgi:YidC/Oxa1 family membrane protein insertase
MDLGQPERVYIFGFGVPLLAILVVITTYLQSKLMTPATPPTAGSADQSQQMTRMMNLYMPLLMGYFAYLWASGLALYFLVSNVVGIGQYAMMGKLNFRNLLPARFSASKSNEKSSLK